MFSRSLGGKEAECKPQSVFVRKQKPAWWRENDGPVQEAQLDQLCSGLSLGIGKLEKHLDGQESR